MSELVEWLTKVLDEDEADFGRAAEAEAERCRNDGIPDATREQVMELWLSNGGTFWPRKLADIAAKRAIIEECAYWRNRVEQTADAGPTSSNYGTDQYTVAAPILRLLASAYADRPGYDESWRP